MGANKYATGSINKKTVNANSINLTIQGNKFAHFRKKLRLTQFDVLAEIQKRTGKRFRQGTISSWETGKTVPDMEVLRALASIYNVKVDDLYEQQEQEKPELISSITLSVFQSSINQIHQSFEKGNTEEAYLQLKEVSDDMLTQLAKISDEYHRMKNKIQTLQDVINL